jgi:hypothetical protein
MNRRNFLIACGGSGVLGLAGRLGHQVYAREQLRRDLTTTASPLLIDKHNRESQRLPQETRDEVRRWFHGKCLNAASFVHEVCAGPSREVLGSLANEDARFAYLYERFCNRVVSHAEIMNRIVTIQEEAGDVIDVNWSACCSNISQSWGTGIRHYNSTFSLGDLSARLDPMIRQQLKAAVDGLAASNAGEDPMRKLLASLGRTTTLMLVPMTRLPNIAIPTFLFTALVQLFGFIYESASNPVAGYQAELSARLAHLGNRIGNEFETAVKNQLAEIHAIQDAAVTQQALIYANDAVPAFI